MHSLQHHLIVPALHCLSMVVLHLAEAEPGLYRPKKILLAGQTLHVLCPSALPMLGGLKHWQRHKRGSCGRIPGHWVQQTLHCCSHLISQWSNAVLHAGLNNSDRTECSRCNSPGRAACHKCFKTRQLGAAPTCAPTGSPWMPSDDRHKLMEHLLPFTNASKPCSFLLSPPQPQT